MQLSPVRRLHAAVRRGDADAVRELLAADLALTDAASEADPRKPRPLHIAIQHDRKELFQLLLEQGADYEAIDDEYGATSLIWVAFHGRLAMAPALLERGARLDARNKVGLTALGCALEGVKGNLQFFSDAGTEDWQAIADLLREAGAPL